MTLITYPVRVHFADGMLEEALRSEIERLGHAAPLILGEEGAADPAFAERIAAGLPRRVRARFLELRPGAAPQAAFVEVVEAVRVHDADVIVAYGSVRAIAIARRCRSLLRGGADGHRRLVLDLFALPGVDGLPAPCRTAEEHGPGPADPAGVLGLPSILICDPTVTLGAGPVCSSGGAVRTLARCLEAYLSPAYNPPADGMALDGAMRCAATLPRLLAEDSLDVRREQMAAALNAVLAQAKGAGLTERVSEALAETVDHPLDPGSTLRLVLPGALRIGGRPDGGDGARRAALSRALGLAPAVPLADGVERLMADLPLARSLSGLGLTRANLADAVRGMGEPPGHNGRPRPGEVLRLLQDVL